MLTLTLPQADSMGLWRSLESKTPEEAKLDLSSVRCRDRDAYADGNLEYLA